MVIGIKSAASGMIAQQMNIDIISNNLANVNTPGFKEIMPVFKRISDMEIKEKNKEAIQLINNNYGNNIAVPTNSGRVIGSLSSGCAIDSTVIDFKQGSIKKTDNNLDFAINGKGFFVVENDGEEFYTRNGSFTINEEGTLVTKDGKPVLGERGLAINFDMQDKNIKDLIVEEDGTILFNKEEIDKLKIVEFEKPLDLITVGHSLFKKANEEIIPKEPEDSKINQGFVEGSNSNLIGAMINTITATRTYESLSKVVKESDSTLRKSVNDVGRLKEM